MCGIVGYVGEKQALQVVVDGLRRMEYRGYDSAGVAVVADHELDTRKKAGKLANLETLLGMRVKVTFDGSKGALTVYYSSLDQLDGLLSRITHGGSQGS